MTDLAGGASPSQASHGVSSLAAPPATQLRATELLYEWLGFSIGSGKHIETADLQAEWERCKQQAMKELRNGR